MIWTPWPSTPTSACSRPSNNSSNWPARSNPPIWEFHPITIKSSNMKTKSLVSLVAVLSLTPAVVLRAQEQPAPVAVQPAQAGVEKAWAEADEARAQADAEFKKAQGQLDHAQKLIDEQVLQVDSLPSGFSQRLVRLGPSRGATRTLVIRSS